MCPKSDNNEYRQWDELCSQQPYQKVSIRFHSFTWALLFSLWTLHFKDIWTDYKAENTKLLHYLTLYVLIFSCLDMVFTRAEETKQLIQQFMQYTLWKHKGNKGKQVNVQSPLKYSSYENIRKLI